MADRVKLDENTLKMVNELVRLIEETNQKVNLVLQTYINAKGLDGQWDFSLETGELVRKVEEGEEKEKEDKVELKKVED